ncbi:MAG: PAS domain S-box protein [Planctomycetes bacterium]|nr:PAS domain S-box protein [Planctomycetota bacterium]
MNSDQEQANSDEEFRKRNNLLEAILNFSPDLYYVYDLVEQKNLYSNDGVQKMLGYSPKEILEFGSQLISQLMHPEDYKIYIKETIRRYEVAKDNERIVTQYRMKHSDGEWRWLESTESIYARNSNGSPSKIVGIMHDITERKQTETDYNDAMAMLQVALDCSPAGIAIAKASNGELQYVNDSALRIRGKSKKEIVNGIGIDQYVESWKILHLDGTPYKDDEVPLARAIMYGETCNKQFIVQRPNCEDRIVWAHAAPVRNESGEIIAGIVVFPDITEMKNAELALEAEKERLAVTLRSIGDGVITTDTDGNILMLNKAAEKLTGWSTHEASGRPLPDVLKIINERTRETCDNPASKVLATNGIVEMDNHTCLITKDGREIIIADRGAPIRDKDGHVIGVVLVIRDMTEELKLNESMQRAQKLESLGVLAGGIAHDFNNLLGGIFGHLDLAHGKVDDEKVSHHLGSAIDSIDRARGLTQQLLTFAKGGEPIRSVSPLFPSIQRTVNFALSGSNISCSFETTSDLYLCNFDKNQIGQVIENLVINAVQSMPDGGSLKVNAKNQSFKDGEHATLSAGDYVQISIIDHGAGIPIDLLSRIFDPFYTTKSGGHGLGLTSSYSIVNRHEGCIDVESKPGIGSTFHVYLPATAESELPLAEGRALDSTGSGTILVMDDERVMREVIGEMLEDLGFSVVLTKSGEEALAWIEDEANRHHALVGMIFDLTIPGGMGGKEAIVKIRESGVEVPVFVASGYAGDPIMSNPKNYGFSASISKPFQISELAKMLEDNIS